MGKEIGCVATDMVCGKGFVGDDLKMSKRSFRFGKQRKKGDRAIFLLQNRLRPCHVAAGAVALVWPCLVPSRAVRASASCLLRSPASRCFAVFSLTHLLLIH